MQCFGFLIMHVQAIGEDKDKIHALTLKTMTPEKWAALEQN
jgi:acid stress-induced BolA-like protein IbaG/YrbA